MFMECHIIRGLVNSTVDKTNLGSKQRTRCPTQ